MINRIPNKISTVLDSIGWLSVTRTKMLEASCIQNFDLLHGDMLRFLGQPILNSKLAVCGESPG